MKKLPSITKGELFMCREHQLDYRLLCDECIVKHGLFQRAIRLSNPNRCPCGKVVGMKKDKKIYKTYCDNVCRLKYQRSVGNGVNTGKRNKPFDYLKKI